MFLSLQLKNNRVCTVLGVLALLFLCSCQPAAVTSRRPANITGIEKILIFPFKDMADIYGENVNGRSELDGDTFLTGRVEKNSALFMTDCLNTLLKENPHYEIIPSDRACCVVPQTLEGNVEKPLPELAEIVETGRSAGADAVLVGHLYRFEDRVGKKYSADQPASVSFKIYLVKLIKAENTGRVVWVGRFDETQRALFENFFKLGNFIKRRGQWITAYEMASAGLENIIKDLPKPQ